MRICVSPPCGFTAGRVDSQIEAHDRSGGILDREPSALRLHRNRVCGDPITTREEHANPTSHGPHATIHAESYGPEPRLPPTRPQNNIGAPINPAPPPGDALGLRSTKEQKGAGDGQEANQSLTSNSAPHPDGPRTVDIIYHRALAGWKESTHRKSRVAHV